MDIIKQDSLEDVTSTWLWIHSHRCESTQESPAAVTCSYGDPALYETWRSTYISSHVTLRRWAICMFFFTRSHSNCISNLFGHVNVCRCSEVVSYFFFRPSLSKFLSSSCWILLEGWSIWATKTSSIGIWLLATACEFFFSQLYVKRNMIYSSYSMGI